MHSIAKFIYYKIMGWKLDGFFPKIDKCVVIIAPHTSNLDFLLGLLIRKVLNEEFNFIGKKALFKWPYGWYFRWQGGMPIDRTKSNNFVSACAALIKSTPKIHLTLAPEGTRSKVAKWKTGFYYIAKEAEVPIVMVAFDYGTKSIKFSNPVFPTEDIEADFKVYAAFYKDIKGKVPRNT
ncbi:1-acyl-sn-glycerol-3-phosphate acyltransferase [Cellulophaga sp. F20128]|uniref:1-acyl-sn-glycerol-3-phosphate acyltransferase n=1 Tax=Cellulophaga sp. F20128 TaxID=2926413 RepID=UPI001FF5A340|nr:1-acyl-sn-glycerol-3-phosphate acyltransferase [Cellulophaga sp. F20128]MCK0156910.1 1-acyl-sn-glycerol-3-phosphate acyltransferase [Cellulophaga sp. F20128]